MKILILLGTIGLIGMGCNAERGVPGHDSRIQTDRGTPGATPNQKFTVTNSNEGTSVPREGGSLDRGATLSNNPAQNAPGQKGQALDKQGTGFQNDTK